MELILQITYSRPSSSNSLILGPQYAIACGKLSRAEVKEGHHKRIRSLDHSCRGNNEGRSVLCAGLHDGGHALVLDHPCSHGVEAWCTAGCYHHSLICSELGDFLVAVHFVGCEV